MSNRGGASVIITIYGEHYPLHIQNEVVMFHHFMFTTILIDCHVNPLVPRCDFDVHPTVRDAKPARKLKHGSHVFSHLSKGTLPKTNNSPLKIGGTSIPKGKSLSSNHPFSGGEVMLLSGRKYVFFPPFSEVMF